MGASSVAGADPRRHGVREPGSGRFARATPPADPPQGDPPAPDTKAPAPTKVPPPAAGERHAAPLPLRLYRDGLAALRRGRS